MHNLLTEIRIRFKLYTNTNVQCTLKITRVHAGALSQIHNYTHINKHVYRHSIGMNTMQKRARVLSSYRKGPNKSSSIIYANPRQTHTHCATIT